MGRGVIGASWPARAVLVGLLTLSACKRPAPPNVLPDGPIHVDAVADRWSPEGLAAMRDALQPLVEKHAGRKFTRPPAVEVFDPEAFAAFSRQEARLIMDAIYNDTPEPIRARMAEAEATLGSGGLFGKYGLYDRKTYLVPETIEAAGREVPEGHDPDGRDVEARIDALAKVILAHELTHALQNQEHDGATLLPTLIDLDHFHGWSAVSEGGANWVALRVARDLGIEDVFWEISGHQGWSREGLESPRAYPIWMRYGKGMTMLEEVTAEGGLDAFWRWHAAPPASSSMVFRPSTYSPTAPERTLDWQAVLRGTDQALTEGAWMASNTRLGEYVLRGEAIRTGHEAAFEPILAHLVDAQHLDLMMPDRTGDIRVMVFDAPEHARTYLELLRAEQTEEGRLLAKMLGVTVEVTYTEVNGVKGDASLLRTQRVPMGSGWSEERTAWVVRGTDVVSVTAARFRPGVRLADTLNAVFRQLDAARAATP